MVKPIIGICSSRQVADWRGWPGLVADILTAEYAQAVEAAGGIALHIPPLQTSEEAAAVVSRLDGIIFSGGVDIDPARYHQEPAPTVTDCREDRDVSEFALLSAADERGLPVLGICRGMQLLAVAAGGSLVQHLPDLLGTEAHSGAPMAYSTNTVGVETGHRISDLLDPTVVVPCHHHQSVAEHPGYVATAYSEDGVLHAIERPGDRYVVGVQWHPESSGDNRLFSGLVEAARTAEVLAARN